MTYEELLAECEMHGFKLMPKDELKVHTFTVIARFERGLGPEYLNLRDISAVTICEAEELAWGQASMYFQSLNDSENIRISEVRIRPIN